MTSIKNDYSLLRPFYLEAAKRGEPFVFIACGKMYPRKFIAGPDTNGSIIIQDENGCFDISTAKPYNMAPLAWVEGKPVYKGDVLYSTFFEHQAPSPSPQGRFVVTDKYDCPDEPGLRAGELSSNHVTYASCCSWNPPKVKRECWVNIYGYGDAYIHTTKDNADSRARANRIACVRIEWEE